MLPESTPLALAAYRAEKARELLKDAQLLFKAGQWSSANNRSYYALFHGMRALLATKAMDFNKHSAVIAALNREFIHTGAMDRAFLTVINNASIIRNHSDYDDFYVCSQEETAELIADVMLFLQAAEEYLFSAGCQIPSKDK